MIQESCGLFRLTTEKTSYLFRVTKYGHLEHVHWGERAEGDIESLAFKRSAMAGTSVTYTIDDPMYSLDTIPLEYSGVGKGDYRHTPMEVKMPDGTFVNDFVYQSHEIMNGMVKMCTLPQAYGECDTLVVTLKDKASDVLLKLYYAVFEKENVITRRAELINNDKDLTIRKLMSMSVDLPLLNYEMVTFDGGWISEHKKSSRRVEYGLYVNDSTTGSSSNRHNAGIILAEAGAGEHYGRIYGFNLIYSGNHYTAVERSKWDTIRVMSGLNPHCFEWKLKTGERFETPEAVLSFSAGGFNGLSKNFHNFINEHIVRGEHKGKDRPVLINGWEAFQFDFNERRLLRLAKRAKKLGAEMLVMDDGWFAGRGDDTAGLGDYGVDKKKLPHGIDGLAARIKKLGLTFGIWVEPECVNEKSLLFKEHPDWAVRLKSGGSAYGRNQLVLDLCNSEVRDHIVGRLLETINKDIDYVKWDFNRHISDMYSPTLCSQGEFFHRYVLGLYDIMERVFSKRSHVLLETCSSGGNRFDLGMLCYSPQIWCSDDTDPIERLSIQGGLSYLYPPSAMGTHISSSPHQQTLRTTAFSTRFNLSVFGLLGLELDLKHLTPAEKKQLKSDIAFYKENRRLFQYGDFTRAQQARTNQINWQVTSTKKDRAVIGHFQTIAPAAPGHDILPMAGLSPDQNYAITTKPQGINIRRFGNLINFILPFNVNPEGFLVRTVSKYYMLPDCVEEYTASGAMLQCGVKLNNQFIGTYYNKNVRLLGDFGSSLYIVKQTSVQ